jgi:hypothetical protein
MAELTPAEQKFFETGELTPEMQMDVEPPIDRIALAGLGAQDTPDGPAPIEAPVSAPAPEALPDVAEVLRRSLAEAQQRVAQLEQHINQAQQPTVEAPKAPDPITDPLGAMMHQLDSVNKTVLELQTKLTQQQTQSNQLLEFQKFQSSVQELKNQFVKTAPDFDAAYKHVRDNRVSDLRTFGLTDPQIQQTLFQEEATLAENAIRNGRNPAEVIYEMAKRHGYTAKQTTEKAVEKLTKIEQGQASARVLPKSPVPADITLAGLKEASDADLSKYVLDPKLWAKIAGGDSYPL